ncbi:acyl-CoA dehydrogenase family protein [Lysobacter fragariae]
MDRQHFDSEHEAFRDAVRRYLDKEVVPHQQKWLEDGIVPREAWQGLGEQGFLLTWLDESLGGSGLQDFRYEQVVLEEIGRINETGLFTGLHSTVVAPYLAHFGNDEQKQRFLPKAASGECILALAMTEPGTGSDLAGMRATAVRDGDDWILNGAKTFISNGINADLVIVAARTVPDQPHAIGLFLVERGMPGFERGRKLEKLGMHSQDTSELFFNDVRVPAANVLGDPVKGFKYMMHGLAQERLTCAIGAVAAAESALQTTIDYVKGRKAFGQRIADFQNTRFKLAELRAQIDASQAFVDHCVRLHNDRKLDAETAAGIKLITTEMVGRVADECLQLHGGYGYMLEYPICRIYADVRIQRIFAGTSEVMKEIISRKLLAD